MLVVVTNDLPIHAIRRAFDDAIATGPVVITSPTGSGKSTEVPRWLAASNHRVIVVEPRRVACRTLAARVAELEAGALGERVGYAVRDDAAHGERTRILFATPGIVLRSTDLVASADVLVLDELHERSLELDLLLALFTRRSDGPRLVVMSATLEGERVASHLDARLLSAEGRAYPVDVRFLGSNSSLPDVDGLVSRVSVALARAASDPGDVLVFLPGKGEIDACARALDATSFDVIPLHGGLSMSEQRRAFAPSSRRKLVLATNVAETSVTIPGIGVVIDSGLVRRTRYHDGRSFLTLAPIAEDAATQRAGRAGRTGPGVAYRLWSAAARLAPVTPPEIHRESLVPLVMNAAAWGRSVESLPFLDAPKPYALDAARDELRALGALDDDARLTERGRELFGLPLDAKLARLLVEAKHQGTLDDVIDLVSALSVGRPLLLRTSADGGLVREGDCDASALVRAMRSGSGSDPALSSFVLDEARRTRTRLRRAYELPSEPPRDELDRVALVRTAIAADPRSAYVTRLRGRSIAFANGGTELELARESLLGSAKPPEAIVVFESRAFGSGADARVLVTAGSPVSLDALARAGLGRDRIERVAIERGKVVAVLERVYAKRTLTTREDIPTGALAREAFATLYLRGSLFRESKAASEERLAITALAAKLGPDVVGESIPDDVPDLPTWVAARLEELGIESGEDLALLSPADLLVPDVSYLVRSAVERDYPRAVNIGDASYRVDYDLDARRVTLVLVRGQRKDPPPLTYLPKFPGFGIVVSTPRGTHVLRARG